MIQHNPSSVVTWCQHVLQAFHPWTGIKSIVSVTGMIWKFKWYLTRVVKIGHKVDFMVTLPQLRRFLQTDWPPPAPGPKHSYPSRWPSNVLWSQALLLKPGYYNKFHWWFSLSLYMDKFWMDNLKHHFTFANKLKSKYPFGPKVENTPEGGIAIAPISVSVVAKVIEGLKNHIHTNHL